MHTYVSDEYYSAYIYIILITYYYSIFIPIYLNIFDISSFPYKYDYNSNYYIVYILRNIKI